MERDNISEEIEMRGAYGFTSWDDLFLKYYWDYIIIPLTHYTMKRYEMLKTAFYIFDSYVMPYLNREQKEAHEEWVKNLFQSHEDYLNTLNVADREKQEQSKQKWLFKQWHNHLHELLVKTGKSGKISIIDAPRLRK